MTSSTLAVERFELWGTVGALCVSDPRRLRDARAILDAIVNDVDSAASRFRPDAELLALNGAAGAGPFRVSATLWDLISTAVDAARLTGGACDPTVLPQLLAIGYDRDIEEIRGRDVAVPSATGPAPGVGAVVLDADSHTVMLAAGCALDLGATAKARCADLAAERIAMRLSTGCVVDLGGDLRCAGPSPDGGWVVGIAGDARADVVDQSVSVREGGVASSSTRLRRWRLDGREVHHVVDPATGRSAGDTWALATVSASTCVRANALSTAAIVWGEDALFEVPQRGACGRLVRADGAVELVGGWPEEHA